MSLSPADISRVCLERAERQNWRNRQYALFYDEWSGGGYGQGGIRGSYADGRPALQDLSEMASKLRQRKGAPNLVKPVVDDRVAVTCVLPTVTFDAMSDAPDDQKTAELASRVVRGQYDISQMAVGQTRAAFFNTLFGEVPYTLDPLRPKAAKESQDPFAIPGVYINVHDPRHAYPRFGTGREHNRVQDLFLLYRGTSEDEIEELYPDAMAHVAGGGEKIDIIVHYTKQEKCIVVSRGQRAFEVFRDDHKYGFCPAEWGINKTSGGQFGVSEIDQTVELHHNSQALYHLAMDAAIMATFPPMHVHNAEHVGRVRYGPLAIIETSEDGKVEPLVSTVNPTIATSLHDLSSSSMLKQTGTSPIRQDMQIQHSNTSGRAINNAQGPMQARIDMSNILLGSTLEWVNAKIAMILFKDAEFNKSEMSVHGVEFKGKRGTVTFKGGDLGGLWRNHVQWADPLGSNKHETLAMSLQLKKEGLISGRKVLESIGEDDPEALIKEAHAEQAAMAAGQGGPPGGPGPSPAPGGPPGPTDAAQQGMALAAGAMPGGPSVPGPDANGAPPGGPVQGSPPPPGPPGGGMPGFPPTAAAPGDSSGGATPVPDIWGMVQQIIATLKLHGDVVQAIGTPKGILVTATDHRDVGQLKMMLKPVAEATAGPGAKVDVEVQGKGSN